MRSLVERAGGMPPVVLSGAIGGDEFAAGFDRAMVIAAGLSIGAGVIGWFTVRQCVATHTTQQTSPTSGCIQRSLPSDQPAAAAAG